MEAASIGIIGLIGGFVVGKNWKRIKRWLSDRLNDADACEDIYLQDLMGGVYASNIESCDLSSSW